MKKIYFGILFLVVCLVACLPSEVWGCENSTVNVVFRDSNGDFIPNINFSIFVQIYDVDGNPKPGASVASGKVNSITGRGTVNFTSKYSDFVIKAWDKNSDEGTFYFYNDLEICGGDIEVNEYLSAINFSFRDTSGNLIKNKSFSLYTQRYDADGNPIKEKQDLVATLNTSEEGNKTVYVSESYRSIDREGTNYYIMETKGPSGGIYQKYDIGVSDGDTTEVDYIFSDCVFNVKDENGVFFPAGEKISIYKQVLNDEGESVFGDFVKAIYTDDSGSAIFQYPAGVYTVRFVGENNQNLDFFDIEIFENERSEYDFFTNGDWTAKQGVCDLKSAFTINTKDMDGEVLGGVKYELYEQGFDANGIIVPTVKKLNGQVDSLGKGTSQFNPDPRKKYALKLYVHNSKVGEFWYFNELQFSCGSDIAITKQLPALKVTFRKGDNSLIKNKKFSIYTQKFDVDGFPIKEKKDLVSAEFTTSLEGQAKIYISSDHLFDKEKKGTYVLAVKGENDEKYVEYDIKMEANKDTDLEYIFSDIVVELKQSDGRLAIGKEITVYSRNYDVKGEYVLGKKHQTVKTDNNGKARFPLPAGFYVLRLKDSLGQNIDFWNIRVSNRKRSNKKLAINTTRVSVCDAGVLAGLANKTFKIYSLKQNNEGQYERNKQIKEFKTGTSGYKDLLLASNPYLLTAKKNKKEYGIAFYADNKKFQKPIINFSVDNIINPNQKYSLKKPIGDIPLFEKLAGRILLQVESRGEAWYVDSDSHKRYYMKDGPTAYSMMREFGLGISNSDIKKIPIGLDERFDEFDYDGDLVPDKMEEALGTDMYNHDSDGDGYQDGEEIINAFNPLGEGNINIDQGLADRLRGKILLQVESRGEAWYVHPENGKRYYMKDGESAYEIMRFLSLGITNENLEEIEAGNL